MQRLPKSDDAVATNWWVVVRCRRMMRLLAGTILVATSVQTSGAPVPTPTGSGPGTCVVKQSAVRGGWRGDLTTLLRGVGLGVGRTGAGGERRHPGADPGYLRAHGGGDRRAGRSGAHACAAAAADGSATWRAQIGQAWRAVPWRFVLVLGAGMGGAPLLFSHPVGAMLDAAPHAALAFFLRGGAGGGGAAAARGRRVAVAAGGGVRAGRGRGRWCCSGCRYRAAVSRRCGSWA